MTPNEFCYWLQGYFEIQEVEYSPDELSVGQIQVIRDHLKLVFKKETPCRITPLSEYVQYTDGISTSC
jgi:uncharacterized cupin superfamily protein